MLISKRMFKNERLSHERFYSLDNPKRTSSALHTIQNHLSWRNIKVPWSQRVMVHRLLRGIRRSSKLFRNILHPAKGMVEGKMKKRHNIHPKWKLTPCRDDRNDRSNLLSGFQTMYKSSMRNRLETELFWFSENVDIIWSVWRKRDLSLNSAWMLIIELWLLNDGYCFVENFRTFIT